jgi:putative SOS response-associated peptidase YedK
MCGRFSSSRDVSALLKRLGSTWGAQRPAAARYNFAPTQPVLAIVNDDARTARELRWGLIPSSAPSPDAVKLSTFNARVETIATAPTYRLATRAMRCLVLADGFYEWRKNADGSKTPFWIHRVDREPFPFAGLWAEWRSRDAQTRIASCTLITAPANAFMAPIHSRMPIALTDDAARAWLTPGEIDARAALDILVPAEHEREWVMDPVSPRVGNVRNDDPDLIARVESSPAPELPFT